MQGTLETHRIRLEIASIFFLTIIHESAFAWDCPKSTTLEQDFLNSKFVMYGLKGVCVDSSNGTYRGLAGDLKSLELFKGSSNSFRTVFGAARTSGGACTLKLEIREYVLNSNEEYVFTSACSF